MFPISRSNPHLPPPEYRDHGSDIKHVSLSYGGSAWLVTGYRPARSVLADPNFSSDSTNPHYPEFPLASKRRVPGHFLSMDPPQHTRLRALVAGEFSASRMRALRADVERIAAETVADFLATGSPADLVPAVAMTVPTAGAALVLGVPAVDRGFFAECAKDLQFHDASTARRVVAAGRVNHYLAALIETKSRAPGEDVLSKLAAACAEFTEEELVGIANLILVAGLETTAGLIGLTMLSLLQDDRQGGLVRTDPARWAAPAVDEALRYWTIVQHGVARVALDDVDVAGQTVRRDDAVVVHLPTANRDASVFTDPDTFDITRRTQGQLSFGHGVHRCLGSALARLQAEAAVAELFRRAPQLRLADPDATPAFLDDMLVYGVTSLPVSW